nr:hypothetical protein [Tanacetum cinerariifolium]
GAQLGAGLAQVLEPPPKKLGIGIGLIALAGQVVLAQRGGQGHTVHVAAGRGVGRVNVGVGIYPNDTQRFVWERGLYAGNSGVGTAVVAAQHQRKLAEAQRLLHGAGHAFLHGINGVDVPGVPKRGGVEQRIIQVGHCYRIVASEVVGALVEASHAQGIDAHAGAAGTGPQLRANFQNLNAFHRMGKKVNVANKHRTAPRNEERALPCGEVSP